VRNGLKLTAHVVSTLLVLPALVSFVIRRSLMGADRALEGSTQGVARLPGVAGCVLRRAFLCRVLASCDRTATVEFGTIFSQIGARLDANVYVGPRCHLGLVHLERDVLLAAGVHVPSGAETHGAADVDRPIRDQPGRRTLVRIGEGAWVGSAAVVMHSVGCHAIVGAGAVVTTPIPDYAVAVGVPARVVRDRRAAAAQA
jgi:acetyltransferase-like isoleucine patch superfamily enzyme